MFISNVFLQLFLLAILVHVGESSRSKSCSSREFCIALSQCPPLMKKLEKLRAIDQRKKFRKHICNFKGGQIYVCCPRLPRKWCLPSAFNQIIGGQDVKLGSLPWMAALRFKRPGFANEVFGCSGSVINSRYVLTAAHCLDIIRAGAELRAIHLGETDLTVEPECLNNVCYNNIVAGYEKLIVHPEFNPATFSSDIALIRLNVSLDFNIPNVWVAPICLATHRFNLNKYSHRSFTVAGWGFTENKTQSDILRTTLVSLAKSERCKRIFGSRYDFEGESQICAGGVKGRDTCKGDSGGPLVLSGPGGSPYLQVGIVSYGPSPCGIDIPAVYTSVSKYRSWINRQLEP